MGSGEESLSIWLGAEREEVTFSLDITGWKKQRNYEYDRDSKGKGAKSRDKDI